MPEIKIDDHVNIYYCNFWNLINKLNECQVLMYIKYIPTRIYYLIKL